MQSINLKVTGTVQGVGFRFSTLQLARKFNLTGFVANESDGSVYIEAQGAEADLEQFATAIKHSPSPFARINQVTINQQPNQPFTNFDIR
ncbi:acylphosphatase [Paucilactobacillus hokkaidonensis JCM 18461]|uniref:Acylphosphatase n=2 Tax=Paucilactobacillus hokkaidonensis TaxID=1193095 RepID=A0A0A1GX08_9LACO|nr:acylphosphatase [Paucilactobacillus hokkaidonensis]KRO08275.1 hypothetical protein IV59_GL001269 [Paucilactobacillus hokkaidonensis]BAP85458.1 acylphosphatase [Paucilactobacillus hokkaidonensis JCM 18461]